MTGHLPAHLASTLAVLAVAIAVEQQRPAFAVPAGDAGRRRFGRNGVLAASTFLVVFVALVPLKEWSIDHQLVAWPDAPRVIVMAAGIVLLDLVDYGYHRAAHVTALWRFHQVHHLDEGFDATTTLRIHPIDVFLGGLTHLPAIVLLGIPIEGIVAYNLVFVPVAVVHHSNARLPPGLVRAAGRLLVTPPFHMTHHRAEIRNTNSNYASILVAWDHLFGTANPAVRSPGDPMGVDYAPDEPVGALLARPFGPQQYATGESAGR